MKTFRGVCLNWCLLSENHPIIRTTLFSFYNSASAIREIIQTGRKFPVVETNWESFVTEVSVLTLAAVRDEVDGWDGHDDDAHYEVRHGQAHDEHVGHRLQPLLGPGHITSVLSTTSWHPATWWRGAPSRYPPPSRWTAAAAPGPAPAGEAGQKIGLGIQFRIYLFFA